MGSLYICTGVVILYQTLICIVASWLILSCQLTPDPSELQEITLEKLLYLYDPGTCGRIFFYNTSIGYTTSIVWPVKNVVAASFYNKIKVWLCLHVAWMVLYLVYLTQRQRTCGFYVGLLPFTAIGIAMLIVDLVYCSFFLRDATITHTEKDIVLYINQEGGDLRHIKHSQHRFQQSLLGKVSNKDTSWVALIMAYCSCRGIVQWVVNFWIVKDNYFSGKEHFQKLRMEKTSRKCSRRDAISK